MKAANMLKSILILGGYLTRAHGPGDEVDTIEIDHICDLSQTSVYWQQLKHNFVDFGFTHYKDKCFSDCDEIAQKMIDEDQCKDNLEVFDTRGKTCEWYNKNQHLCGFYDTFGPRCEELESDPRGCVGNFTASKDCCACGGEQDTKYFCCNFVDWGDK